MGFKTQENTLCLDNSLGLYMSQILQAKMKPFCLKYCTANIWLDLLFLNKFKLNQILTQCPTLFESM